MSARDVIAKALREHTRVQASLHCSELILAALDAAGYAPPLRTEEIHKALQDAFRAGAAWKPDSSIIFEMRDHCNAALNKLLTAAKETP